MRVVEKDGGVELIVSRVDYEEAREREMNPFAGIAGFSSNGSVRKASIIFRPEGNRYTDQIDLTNVAGPEKGWLNVVVPFCYRESRFSEIEGKKIPLGIGFNRGEIEDGKYNHVRSNYVVIRYSDN